MGYSLWGHKESDVPVPISTPVQHTAITEWRTGIEGSQLFLHSGCVWKAHCDQDGGI